MVEFFGAVAGVLAVAAPVVSNLAGIAQGGKKLYDFAADILDRIRKKVPPAEQQAVIRDALTQAAELPQAEFDRKVDEIVELELADKSPADRKAAADYIKIWPERVRSTFPRTPDRPGTTVPADFTAHRPEDLFGVIPPRPARFNAGDTLPDAPNWALVQRLGIGGFGEVWKAQHRRMPNTYRAVKFCLDPVSQGYLELEMENIALVQNALGDHPHVVKLLDVHLDGDAPCLHYEFVEGGELGALVRTWPNDPAVRAALAVQSVTTLADTLDFCHTRITLDGKPRALIHRDMKPANVLLGRNNTLKITDFGISHTQARQALDEARVATVARTATTTAGFVRAGTPMYASEEQLAGGKPQPTDDVHALGVMLYQMILGDTRRPLNRDWFHALGRLHACGPLVDLVARCIASDSAARFKHAGELLDALKSLPQKLIAPPVRPVILSQAELDAGLRADMDDKYADADAKNAAARGHLDRREWAAAVTTLESVFHPRMRDPDLYARAVAFRDGKKLITPLGMEFALVPKGTFWMGGADGKCGDKQVNMPNDFYIGVFPVTQEEWQKVMNETPSHFRKGGGGADKVSGVSDADLKRFPVESVSWDHCQKLIQKLNDKFRLPGMTYRLPTEYEWEYACRGAATTKDGCGWNYYFGTPTNTLTPQLANFKDSGLERTTKVGSYKPNSLGLYDMHGNVWEWCQDWSDSEQKHRVLRGGAWSFDCDGCRAAHRLRSGPTNSSSLIGVRLVLSLDR